MQNDIATLLASRGISPRSKVRLLRHTPKEWADLVSLFGTPAFKDYQAIQSKEFEVGTYLVSFYGHRPKHALMLGVWRVAETMPTETALGRGMLTERQISFAKPGDTFHILHELDSFDDLFLRLQIEWGSEVAWNRNLLPGQHYPVRVLSECPVQSGALASEATERLRQFEEDEQLLLERLQGSPDFASLSSTTREAIVLARVGQGEFRQKLIEYWSGCAVTGCGETSLLVASHIVPWRQASNEARLDLYNGLLLTPNLDKLFDRYLVSFDVEGSMLISSSLDGAALQALGIGREMRLKAVEPSHQQYLDQHRKHFFALEARRR